MAPAFGVEVDLVQVRPEELQDEPIPFGEVTIGPPEQHDVQDSPLAARRPQPDAATYAEGGRVRTGQDRTHPTDAEVRDRIAWIPCTA
jgi:hypothetical protein